MDNSTPKQTKRYYYLPFIKAATSKVAVAEWDGLW